MAINYVRFQRGTQRAYEALKTAGTLDKNTLYFIENEDGTGALYMGVRPVSGGSNIITPASLKDLTDVVINETGANSFLIKDSASNNWISKSFEDIISLIEQGLNNDTVIDINNLQNQIDNIEQNIDNIEQNIDNLETIINNKIDIKVFNEALATKANSDDINKELGKKANINEVNEALNLKANIDEVNEALNLKINIETFNSQLSKKADIEALNLKADINEVYTKEEVNNKIATDIDAAIVSADHLKRIKVNSIYDIDVEQPNADQYIYMVPTGLQEEDNKYDEYIVIEKVLEKVGSWEIDLTEYAKKSDLNSKVDIDNNARLMTLDEGAKLSNIEFNAQVNIINSISDDFSINLENNKQLILNTLSINKIKDLSDILHNKVDIQEGYTLLSPDDQKKLSALVINSDNSVELQGLAEWLNQNANTVRGLSENNLTDELYNKLNNSLFISEINTNQLQVNNGKLNIIAVESSKISGLQDLLNEKANQSIVNNLQLELDSVINSLTTYVDKNTYNKDITEIKDILIWKEMS